MSRRPRALAAVAVLTLASGAGAQGWRPERTVEIVVPSAPGGSNDKAVAFKGSAEAVTGVLGGHLDLVTTAAGNAAAHVAAGRLRILGVAAEKRLPGALAAVPTWKEQGVNVVSGGWRAIMGPRGLGAAQSAWWQGVLQQVVATPEWKDDLARNFWSDDFAAGERFAAALKTEYAVMRAVLGELGLAK